jgi:pimeloyl-ACP methyl ester carboxylesterase
MVARATAAALGILCVEPHHALKIGCFSCFGLKKKFNWHNLNPKEISQKQSEKTPLLLLHGQCHTQGVWISLAKAIQKAGIDNPVYTVNLKQGDFSEEDFQRIDDKIKEIQGQYQKYGKETSVNLVGYSRGAALAYASGLEGTNRWVKAGKIFFDPNSIPRESVDKIVLIGAPISNRDFCNFGDFLGDLKKSYNEKVYEITGNEDFLVPLPSCLPAERQFTADCGHLGLPFSPAVQSKIIEWNKNMA